MKGNGTSGVNLYTHWGIQVESDRREPNVVLIKHNHQTMMWLRIDRKEATAQNRNLVDLQRLRTDEQRRVQSVAPLISARSSSSERQTIVDRSGYKVTCGVVRPQVQQEVGRVRSTSTQPVSVYYDLHNFDNNVRHASEPYTDQGRRIVNFVLDKRLLLSIRVLRHAGDNSNSVGSHHSNDSKTVERIGVFPFDCEIVDCLKVAEASTPPPHDTTPSSSYSSVVDVKTKTTAPAGSNIDGHSGIATNNVVVNSVVANSNKATSNGSILKPISRRASFIHKDLIPDLQSHRDENRHVSFVPTAQMFVVDS
jgi:hypothetical protein